MVPSPIKDPRLKELAFQTRFAAELLKAYNAFMEGVTKVERLVQEAKDTAKLANEQLSRIHQLPRGPQGIQGPRGVPGPAGKDGYSPSIEEITGAVMRLVRIPKDGKDGKDADEEKIVKMVVKELKKQKIPLKEDFEGMRSEISSYRHQLAGKHYGKDTWARGGGDTVIAGTNVTIVPNENGQKVISANGGGSSILTETVTATDAGGNNVNIDLTQLSQPWTSIQMVIRNGVIQNQSKWSIVGDTLTLTGAVTTNDFQIQYIY